MPPDGAAYQVYAGITFRVARSCAKNLDCSSAFLPSSTSTVIFRLRVLSGYALLHRPTLRLTLSLWIHCVRQSYRKKFVRATVRARAVHRMRHHLSAPALSFQLDFGRQGITPRALYALQKAYRIA